MATQVLDAGMVELDWEHLARAPSNYWDLIGSPLSKKKIDANNICGHNLGEAYLEYILAQESAGSLPPKVPRKMNWHPERVYRLKTNRPKQKVAPVVIQQVQPRRFHDAEELREYLWSHYGVGVPISSIHISPI